MDCKDEASVITRRNGTRQLDEHPYVDRATGLLITSEMLRNSVPTPKSEEKLSVFWRVFGGTILSITALVCIQVYQSLNSSIGELRTDQNRMRETAAEYIKKEDLTSRTSTLWNKVQELQNVGASLTLANSKIVVLEQQLATAEKERKELAKELQGLRERIAKQEGKSTADPKSKSKSDE